MNTKKEQTKGAPPRSGLGEQKNEHHRERESQSAGANRAQFGFIHQSEWRGNKIGPRKPLPSNCSLIAGL